MLVSKVKHSVSDNFCYKDSVRVAAINYDCKGCDKLLENANGLYMNLKKSDDPNTFYYSCTSFISSNTEIFFTTLNRSTATLMAINLARQIHQDFLKEKERNTTHNQKIVPLIKNVLNE